MNLHPKTEPVKRTDRPRFYDVSDRALLKLTGSESLDFLQRISTNDLKDLKSGVSVPTILTNEKGRIVDLLSVVVAEPGTIMLVGNSTSPELLVDWLRKYTIMEDIIAEDITPLYSQVLVLNAQEDPIVDLRKDFEHSSLLIVDEGASKWGKRLIVDSGAKSKLVDNLCDSGAEPLTSPEFDRYRIAEGIPGYPQEISLSFNPLELGLWSFVSWTKGCYIGQEVIARLDTYKKVQKALVRMRFPSRPPMLPCTVFCEGVESGAITSSTENGEMSGHLGLGLLRTQSLESGGKFWFVDGDRKVLIEVMSKVVQ